MTFHLNEGYLRFESSSALLKAIVSCQMLLSDSESCLDQALLDVRYIAFRSMRVRGSALGNLKSCQNLLLINPMNLIDRLFRELLAD